MNIFLEMSDFCETCSIVLSSGDNIMCDSSCYDIQYVKLLEIIQRYINPNWISVSGDTKSIIGIMFFFGWKCNIMKVAKQIVVS